MGGSQMPLAAAWRLVTLTSSSPFVVGVFRLAPRAGAATTTCHSATNPIRYASCMFGLCFGRERWKQGATFWRGCESGHWKGEEICDRTGIGAVRPTRDERPFRDGNRSAPASQGFAPTRQTPLKTGEISPRAGGLNGFERVMVAEGTEHLKTLLEVAARIYSEIGESKEVLFNTRAYARLRCWKNKA